MIATLVSPELPTHLQTVDEFDAWEREHPHEGSYEFVRGRIIPKPAMKQNEIFIADYLIRQFVKTSAFQQGDALLPEADSYVDGSRKRIPDLTYITVEQKQAIRRGERVNTLFAIEILSDSESYEDVLDKLQDYFDGGTQLVWYIVPKRQKIFAYTSPDESKAYKEQYVISAAPVVPDLQFAVVEMFA
ncbi:Uma2 family endonuclease [Spirosoma rhododendri]|uniref:Uma2 family endonuclease n=1 Tax=Spirosoma rhododendri TaxID=2728024 RepID=A0A7L5DUY1_9BACT|nr:Uma2 family endonuclease [Spirosoma rhododendri]QJD81153.1 Uma2 family endonuclease [Spirosoma rhododendri]